MPRGWSVSRRSERQWWVFRGPDFVSELGVLGTGEWWLCPQGEILPLAQSYPTAAAAIDALMEMSKRGAVLFPRRPPPATPR
ncbi:MAG TPA: hypothetical protein VGR21_03690 [Cryptosporangiaceae bacterium]|nr:hypothetical protein [Cryptosporangiaceae bacterium]